MEYNKKKTVSANSSLVCFEYKLNQSYDNNNFNYVNDMNSMQKLRKNIPPPMMLLKNNANSNNMNDEEYIHFNQKRNYFENELFSNQRINNNNILDKSSIPLQKKLGSLDIDLNIHNNLAFPIEHISNQLDASKDNQETSMIDFHPSLIPKTNDIQLHSSIETQDEEEKLIFNFVQSNDYKAKIQIVKKLVSLYKKNKHDGEKTNIFLNKLSNGMQKPLTEISAWMQYEYLKNRLESILTSIVKEINKLILTMQVHKLTLNTGEWNNDDATFLKKLITKKTKDYLELAFEEEDSIKRYPFLNQFLESYAPTKGKKKLSNGFYRERLIKRIKEIFEKSHFEITEERVIVLFFPAMASLQNEFNQNNSIYTKIPANNNFNDNLIKPIEETQNINDDIDVLINNDNNEHINLLNDNNPLEHLVLASQLQLFDHSPKKLFRYKVKQFDQEDFE